MRLRDVSFRYVVGHDVHFSSCRTARLVFNESEAFGVINSVHPLLPFRLTPSFHRSSHSEPTHCPVKSRTKMQLK